MLYPFHKASYKLGDRLLNPEERVVVTTRSGPKEPQRIAGHLGVSANQPELLIGHSLHSDEEYTPTFQTRNALAQEQYSRYLLNYRSPDGQTQFGSGLKGRVVYLVHTYSKQFDPQALAMMNQMIAATAKYNGAEAVVLLAYTLNYSAQERGVHDTDHPRMQSQTALFKADGQAPMAGLLLQQYAMAGVDTIITPHCHAPRDLERMCAEVNEKLAPLRDSNPGSTMRYQIRFVEVDLAPMVGLFVSDFGKRNLEFDLSDGGRNVLFMAPDVGAEDFTRQARLCSGLENSALAVMDKQKSADNANIKMLGLTHSDNLSDERGIDGMYIFLTDDCIRSGMTMERNIQALSGMNIDGIVRDPKIRGKPAKVVVYATRTNFAGASTKILTTPAIDHIVITNADPRGYNNTGPIYNKTQMIWINFMMAEAARAVERGEDPNAILTPEYIRDHDFLKVDVPHGHRLKLPEREIL